MVAVERFSRLVSGIHAAAVTPHAWASVTRDVVAALEGIGGGLIFADASNRWQVGALVPPEAIKSYAGYYSRLDHVLAAVERGPVGVVRAGEELIPPTPRTEFHADWIRPYGLEDGLFVRLNAGTTTTSLVVAGPRRSESFATCDRIKLVSGLVVHLQQALRTQSQMADLASRRVELAGVLEEIRHGLVIADAAGQVIHFNSAAEHILRSADGLCLRCGCVAGTTADVDRQLHRALSAAINTGASGIREGRSLSCRRPSGRRPYVIHVTPLDRDEDGQYPGRSRALLRIIDPDREKRPGTALLRHLYKFTNTESEIAVRLAVGQDLKQISDDLVVSVWTVRTHLHHIFEKTGTHRQAELVQYLLAVIP